MHTMTSYLIVICVILTCGVEQKPVPIIKVDMPPGVEDLKGLNLREETIRMLTNCNLSDVPSVFRSLRTDLGSTFPEIFDFVERNGKFVGLVAYENTVYFHVKGKTLNGGGDFNLYVPVQTPSPLAIPNRAGNISSSDRLLLSSVSGIRDEISSDIDRSIAGVFLSKINDATELNDFESVDEATKRSHWLFFRTGGGDYLAITEQGSVAWFVLETDSLTDVKPLRPTILRILNTALANGKFDYWSLDDQ